MFYYVGVTELWKPVPALKLASPEWWLSIPVPCEAGWCHGTEVIHEKPDLTCTFLFCIFGKQLKISAKFRARHHFPPLKSEVFVKQFVTIPNYLVMANNYLCMSEVRCRNSPFTHYALIHLHFSFTYVCFYSIESLQ